MPEKIENHVNSLVMLGRVNRLIWLIRQTGLSQFIRLSDIYLIEPAVYKLVPAYARINRKVKIALAKRKTQKYINKLREEKADILKRTSRGYQCDIDELQLNSDQRERIKERERKEDVVFLGAIDQDGFICSTIDRLANVACVDKKDFVPRKRFLLDLVVLKGRVSVRKNYRGSEYHFIREIRAIDKLCQAGVRVPAIVDIDFETLSIYLSYIPGTVLREALAIRGAKLRDRDVARDSEFTELDPEQLRLRRIQEGRRYLDETVSDDFIQDLFHQIRRAHQNGVTELDIKYGNVIIEHSSGKPFLIDFDTTMLFDNLDSKVFQYFRDKDIGNINLHYDTRFIAREEVQKRIDRTQTKQPTWYAPVYFGSGLRMGRVWDNETGFGRWHFLLKKHLPTLRGARVLDLGANNAFNSMQVLRGGAREAVAVEMSENFFQQGCFVKDVYEWLDNRDYNLKYYNCDMRELPKLGLGEFDFVMALCSIYYLPKSDIETLVKYLATITRTFVLQCNIAKGIGRNDAETYEKASISYAIDVLGGNGFPNTSVIAPRGYYRPLVIGKAMANATC